MEATDFLLWFGVYCAIGLVVAVVCVVADVLDSSDDAAMVSGVVFMWPAVVIAGAMYGLGKSVKWVGEKIKYM